MHAFTKEKITNKKRKRKHVFDQEKERFKKKERTQANDQEKSKKQRSRPHCRPRKILRSYFFSFVLLNVMQENKCEQ